MGAQDYRALALQASGRHSSKLLHLVREDAEASLCGVPRSALGVGASDQLVCADCIDWLARRRRSSGSFRPVKPG
jgi:hypothetical protein